MLLGIVDMYLIFKSKSEYFDAIVGPSILFQYGFDLI